MVDPTLVLGLTSFQSIGIINTELIGSQQIGITDSVGIGKSIISSYCLADVPLRAGTKPKT